MALAVGIDSLDELPPHLCQEARDLIGFWLQRGKEKPTKRLSQQTRDGRFRYNFWESPIRHRIASQVERIKHWHIIEGDYTEAPDVEAHWFVDPPYEKAGVTYVHNQLDRSALAEWCLSRKGFVQVCENDGASWLPFEPFAANHGHRGGPRGGNYSVEAIFEIEN